MTRSMAAFSDLQFILFDLDGTVYQDPYVHRYYIPLLVENTEFLPWTAALCQFCDKVLAGEALEFNAFYLPGTDHARSPEEFFRNLQEMQRPGAEPGTINLGDAWALVDLIGSSLGLNANGRGEELYLKTRAKMLAKAQPAHPRFREVLEQLGQKYITILMSNSGQEVAEEYLRIIGLEGAFGRSVFSARKPHGLLDALNAVDERALRAPDKLLSIGDFYYNDLALPSGLGAKTIWMNPFPGVKPAPCDLELRTVQDLRIFLEQLL